MLQYKFEVLNFEFTNHNLWAIMFSMLHFLLPGLYRFYLFFLECFLFLIFSGIHSVGLNQLMKAPAGFLSKRSSELQTKNIKSVLMELGVSHLPLLPVITTGEWHGTVHEDDRFIIVGGESLFTAVCDLAANKKLVLI